jgi:predicted HicB family RNase H-like nuclease
VPNRPKTPQTPFRIPAELKQAAQAKARAEGRTLTDVVLDALTRYVKTKPKKDGE